MQFAYAAKNAEAIKTSQRIDTVRYNRNGWYLSLMTLDAFKIGEILGTPAAIKSPGQVASKSKTNYVLPAIFLLLVTAAVFIARKRSRQRQG